ncbi:MAG: PAS domain-containing protein [Gammaproteobacteria bacterium]|nr:PAS domain-containing protein [Gammaproteobacteria bacterium]
MAPELRPAELIDALTTGIVLLDADDAVVYLNASAQGMLATGATAALGRPLRELVIADDRLTPLLRRARDSGEPMALRECDFQPIGRRDVQMIVDCTLTPLDASGRGRLLLEIADTTSQQRITRDNALLAQQGGSRLMARQLAHEIKNPLGGLRGAAQLLERELPSESLREYTRVIIGEADRLRVLVDSLLGPTRMPRKELVNVHEVVDRVWRLVSSEAPPGVAIQRDYDPSLPDLSIDRDQMIQAMLNLARNAVQVMGSAGRLVLRTRAHMHVTIGNKRHRVVCAVQFEDDGPGVPAELRDSIFYPLVTGRPGGSGLGLAVAQDLVMRHDGLIEFESRPGRTVFTVLLPIENLK